jgi:AcrR family transcriptional regulator
MVEVRALRDRRRIQTALEVCDATLDLFEDRGVDATRVEDIAAAAGISTRTFFRYFPSKEHAACAGDPSLEAVLDDAVAGLRLDRPLLPQLEDLQRAAIGVLVEHEASNVRSLKLWRLIQAEPALAQVAAGVRNDRCLELAGRMRTALGSSVDDFELDLALAVWQSTAATAYVRWAAGTTAGDPVSLLESYERAVALLPGLMER